MTTPSAEALAQAREQLQSETDPTGYYKNDYQPPSKLVRERATVIELRRQLAEVQAALRAEREARGTRNLLQRIQERDAQLATERQRASDLEEAWNNARAACLRAEQERDAERQRAEAAERARNSHWNNFEYANKMWATLETALEASEAKRKALREALQLARPYVLADVHSPEPLNCQADGDLRIVDAALDDKDTP